MIADKQRNCLEEGKARRRGACCFFITDYVLKGVSAVLSADGVIAADIDAWVPGCLRQGLFVAKHPRSLSASLTRLNATIDIDIINYAADFQCHTQLQNSVT